MGSKIGDWVRGRRGEHNAVSIRTGLMGTADKVVGGRRE